MEKESLSMHSLYRSTRAVRRMISRWEYIAGYLDIVNTFNAISEVIRVLISWHNNRSTVSQHLPFILNPPDIIKISVQYQPKSLYASVNAYFANFNFWFFALICWRMSCGVAPLNGGLPHTKIYAMTPMLYNKAIDRKPLSIFQGLKSYSTHLQRSPAFMSEAVRSRRVISGGT